MATLEGLWSLDLELAYEPIQETQGEVVALATLLLLVPLGDL